MHLVGFVIRKFVTMHGHTNIKKKIRFEVDMAVCSLLSCDTMYFQTVSPVNEQSRVLQNDGTYLPSARKCHKSTKPCGITSKTVIYKSVCLNTGTLIFELL